MNPNEPQWPWHWPAPDKAFCNIRDGVAIVVVLDAPGVLRWTLSVEDQFATEKSRTVRGFANSLMEVEREAQKSLALIDEHVARRFTMLRDMARVSEQPPPTPNDKPAVWDLVLADMWDRDAEGRRKYGVPLQPHNGRDALVDAYQEALDLCVYLRQAIYERDSR